MKANWPFLVVGFIAVFNITIVVASCWPDKIESNPPQIYEVSDSFTIKSMLQNKKVSTVELNRVEMAVKFTDGTGFSIRGGPSRSITIKTNTIRENHE